MEIPDCKCDLIATRKVEYYRVQPGYDGTLYTVQLSDGIAVAYVGDADAYWRRVRAYEVAVVSAYAGIISRPAYRGSDYQNEILLYLAHKALGVEYPAPREPPAKLSADEEKLQLYIERALEEQQ
jgi:hypothetical protein